MIMFGWNKKRATASARHILVKSEDQCAQLKAAIEAGADFAEVAKSNSSCPSGQRGGELGKFQEGAMVKEFNDIVFSGELNTLHGPVQTQFGFHLIEITDRTPA